MRIFSISTQLLLSLLIVFGVNYSAHGKSSPQAKKSKTIYKVENCDCLGYSDGIPTFLSDLPEASNVSIQGEGKTLDDAQKTAQNMCVSTYRNYASISKQEKGTSVTQTGCHAFKSTNNGEWESI